MAKEIDITKDMYFYDDRSKYDYMYRLVTVLYNDDEFALCLVTCTMMGEGIPDEKFLVDLRTAEVKNSDYDSWMATNNIEWAEKEDLRIRERANE